MTMTKTELEVFDRFRTNVTHILQSRNLTEAELSLRAGFDEEGAVTAMLRGATLPNISCSDSTASSQG